jgi:hypothetical protein
MRPSPQALWVWLQCQSRCYQQGRLVSCAFSFLIFGLSKNAFGLAVLLIVDFFKTDYRFSSFLFVKITINREEEINHAAKLFPKRYAGTFLCSDDVERDSAFWMQ